MSQTVSVSLSDSLFLTLKRRAEQGRHSIESEIIKNLEEAFPTDEESLTPELEMIMEALSLMEDHTLWNVASAKIADSVTDQMEELYTKRLTDGLSIQEERELTNMEKMFEKERAGPAQAAMLLKERGLLERAQAETRVH